MNIDLKKELTLRISENLTFEQTLNAFYEMCQIPIGDENEVFFIETHSDWFDMIRDYRYDIDSPFMYHLALGVFFEYEGEELPDDFDDVWCKTPDEFMEKFKNSKLYKFIVENPLKIKKLDVDLEEI